MKKPLYTVRDTMKGYQCPTTLKSDELAIREFGNMAKEHPNKDYFQLWKVGFYDDETGEITSETPTLLVKGADFV